MKAMARTRKPVCAVRKPIRHLDVSGAAFLGIAIAALLAVLFAIATPNADADKRNKAVDSASDSTPLDKKFKGHLPITELTEDQAILHALNRLAYGPRPGDVERVRQMGLEKWIAQQLDPDALDDCAVNTRLPKYPTLNMSSQQLLQKFPPPNQAARQQGLTLEQYKDQQQANG